MTATSDFGHLSVHAASAVHSRWTRTTPWVIAHSADGILRRTRNSYIFYNHIFFCLQYRNAYILEIRTVLYICLRFGRKTFTGMNRLCVCVCVAYLFMVLYMFWTPCNFRLINVECGLEGFSVHSSISVPLLSLSLGLYHWIIDVKLSQHRLKTMTCAFYWIDMMPEYRVDIECMHICTVHLSWMTNVHFDVSAKITRTVDLQISVCVIKCNRNQIYARISDNYFTELLDYIISNLNSDLKQQYARRSSSSLR